MKKAPPLIIKNRKKFLKELAEDKKRNADDNLKFVRLRAEWLKRTSNKEWSERQKEIVDSIYRSNRRLHIKVAN